MLGLAVQGRQSRGLLQDGFGNKFRMTGGAQDHMTAGHTLGVKPDVLGMAGPVGEQIIFLVVASDPDLPAAVNQVPP